MKFKVGDLVRCTNAVGAYRGMLSRGQCYRVVRLLRAHGEDFVELPGLDVPHWYASRFELVTGATVAPQNRSRVDAGPRTL